MELSKKLKLLREMNNLTQDELAAKLKLSRSAISNYESGLRTPDINTLNEICEFYNITLDSLFSENLETREVKKSNSKKVITIIAISLIIIIILIILIPNLINKKYDYGYDIDNDELKVKNCNEIAVVRLIAEVERNTYELEVINQLKGEDFKYVTIHNKKIDVEENSFYLIFGNRYLCETENINYITIDHVDIYDHQFIYELDNFNSTISLDEQGGETSTIIDYYSYYINSQKSEILSYDFGKVRNESLLIKDKNQYINNYDNIDLNVFDDNFKELNKLGYNFIDIDISMKVNISNNTIPMVYIYNSIEHSDVSRMTYCKMENNTYDNHKYEHITIHFKNVSLKSFYLDNQELIIRYGYEAMSNSSWINSDLSVKVGIKK